MKEVLLKHNRTYPNMQLGDFVKLLYQACFGPAHMHDLPTKEQIKTYLEKELIVYKDCQKTDTIESISDEYVRISLRAVKDNLITKEELVQAFYDSMNTSPKRDETSYGKFYQGLITLIILVERKQLDFSLEATLDFLNAYLEKGIHPIHHSETYRDHYAPHYRVVHKKYLKQ